MATNAAIMRGKDVPPYDYMKTSQKFVDVRLAKWCFERGIPRICLPRSNGWLGSSSEVLGIAYDETIHKGFTRTHPTHVADEIYEFAFKTPNIGKLV
ncbi:MAG: hypothetical protein O2873_09865 [Proteobacteria bacterium]|nr:hypothetical protein [Pseudomonadota bacterium]